MTRYIHIEGVDLSGKSSVSKAVVDRQPDEWQIQAATLTRTPNLIRELGDQLDSAATYTSEAIGIVYAAALRADLDAFRYPEINTIQESTILLRSLAYHAINNNPGILRIFEDMASLHPKFDRSYLLTASREERLRRLAQRAVKSTHDLLIVKDPKRFAKMEDSIKDYAQNLFNAEVIDTTQLNIDEVAEYISQDIPIEELTGKKNE